MLENPPQQEVALSRAFTRISQMGSPHLTEGVSGVMNTAHLSRCAPRSLVLVNGSVGQNHVLSLSISYITTVMDDWIATATENMISDKPNHHYDQTYI